MPTLYEQTTINGMRLSNRLVRSATWEGLADPEGRPTDKLVALYRELARGGIGLLVSGYAYVRPEAKSITHQMGIHRDDLEADYRKLVDAVHAEGGKIAAQIAHGGGQASSAVSGLKPVAPSSVGSPLFPEIPRALTVAEIEEIVTSFREGARRAKEWGFDAVQLHGGHGYLFSEFLSPLFNRRDDAYGGSVENRSRFMLETVRAIREAVGADYPVLVKLGMTDHLEGGLSVEEGLLAAKALSDAGVDAIEVSAGTMVSGEKNPCRGPITSADQEGYHLDLARLVKNQVRCPVIVVGGFRTRGVAEKAIAEGFDYVALSRPLIMEPGLPNRWRHDPAPSQCVSCNGCYLPAVEKGCGIYCVAR